MLIVRELTISDPVDRSIKTKRARPSLASQAPKVKITREKNCSWFAKEITIINNVSDKIIASKDKRAISKCFCCQQKHKKALNLAIVIDKYEIGVIAIKILALTSGLQDQRSIMSFYSIS